VTRLEAQRRGIAATIDDARIALTLGEDASAQARIDVSREELAEIDRQLVPAREQLQAATLTKASLKEREAGILETARAHHNEQVRAAHADRVQVAVNKLVPAADALQELLDVALQHADIVPGMAVFPDLSLKNPDSKLRLFLRQAAALGVNVAADGR